MARPEQRYHVDFQVILNWQDLKGVRQVPARCTNLSASGAQIETLEAFPARAVVVVTSEHFGRMGNAVVRYCRRTGMKYDVGLQFTESFRLAEPSRQLILEQVLKKT
jgi:hypothetical protein